MPRRPLPDGIRACWEQVDPRVRERIVEAIAEGAWPLLLCGSIGAGKTSAAALIYGCWVDQRVKWWRAVEFVRVIQTCRREGGVLLPGCAYESSEGSIWRVRIGGPDLLVFDDIGLRNPTQAQYEMIYEVIDRRYAARKPLVVSTNHTVAELAEVFDERIASRLKAGTVIEFNTHDRRPSGRMFRINEATQRETTS